MDHQWRYFLNKFRKHLFFILFCLQFAAFPVCANAQKLPETIKRSLKQAGIPLHSVSILVVPADAQKPLISHNTATAFYTASIMKVVTTYAALEILGPSFTWKTEVYTRGVRNGDILHGDLIIKGSGDPKFLLEDLERLLGEIRVLGIREIRGNVLLDNSAFDPIDHDAAAFDDDPVRPYNAGPSAVLLNYKVFEITLSPDTLDKKVNIQAEPLLDKELAMKPSLTDDECKDWKKLLNVDFSEGAYSITGDYAQACEEKKWLVYAHQMSDAYYFNLAFKPIWDKLGGVFTGTVKMGKVPFRAMKLAEHESPPLSTIIKDVNKYSNNVMARHVLLAIGAKAYKYPANTEKGIRAIKAWMSKKQISTQDIFIENGSGLSREERMSANTMAQLLHAANESPVGEDFISSLSIVGEDGTTWRRLRNTAVTGKAQIKTGAIQDVRTFAGYVLAASGKRYIVVFMANHPKASLARDVQNELLLWVHKNN